jgi:hypothetical protein
MSVRDSVCICLQLSGEHVDLAAGTCGHIRLVMILPVMCVLVYLSATIWGTCVDLTAGTCVDLTAGTCGHVRLVIILPVMCVLVVNRNECP